MKPLAKRNADTMSQMVALPKPERAAAGFSTFKKPDKPTAMRAMAPDGQRVQDEADDGGDEDGEHVPSVGLQPLRHRAEPDDHTH